MTFTRNFSRLSTRFFLVLLLVLNAACDTGENELEIIDRARGYIETNDINAAILELKNVLVQNPKNGEARHLLGHAYLVLGDVRSAEKELRRAHAAGWDEAQVNYSLAQAFFRQGEFEAVLDEIPVKDNYPASVQADLLGLWALSEAGLGKWEDAAETLETAESIDPDSLWLLHGKTRQAIHDKDTQSASKTLEHALSLHPKNQDLWMLKAGLAELDGDLAGADAALQKMIDLDPPKKITAWGRQAHLAQCKLRIKQKQLDTAKQAVQALLKHYPQDPEANFLSGLIAFAENDFDLAEERLLNVFKFSPDHQASLLLFGNLKYAQRDFQQAAYYLEKAASSSPENINVQTMLGKTYLQLGHYDEAQQRLAFAASKSGENAELLTLLGVSRFKEGDTDAALLELEKAAAVDPTNVGVRGTLAKAYLNLGDTERAIKELEGLSEQTGQNRQAEVMLLLAYIRGGEYDKSLGLANKLSEQVPESPLPPALAGLSYEGKQDFVSAQKSYETALEIAPGNSMAKLGLARLAIHAGNIDSARDRYQSVLESDRNNPQALVGLAKILGDEGKLDEAIKKVEQARENNPTALEPRLFLAEYYLRNNLPSQALALATEAATIAPHDARALAVLGRAQLGEGMAEEAEKTLKTLVDKAPHWVDGHFYLAQTYVFGGDLASAEDSLIKALQNDPNHAASKLTLGTIYARTGRSGRALEIARNLQRSKDSQVGGFKLEGDVLMIDDKPNDATRAYQKAFDLSPSSNLVLKIVGSQRAGGELQNAFATLEQWLENYPGDTTARLYLASAYHSDGNAKRAIAEYETIIEQYPNNGGALNNLAWLYHEELNENEKALTLAKKAHQSEPNDAAIMDTYGWLLVETGSVEQGLGLLYKAAASGNSSIRYHLASALARSGQKDKALAELDAILQDEAFPEKKQAEALRQELR